MVGYKTNNVYKKKRKGKPFSGRQRYADNSSVSRVDGGFTDGSDSARSTTTPQNLESNVEVESTRPVSASRRKLNLSEEAEKSALEASRDIDHAGQGYRLIDINKLSSSISKAHVCDQGHLIIHEDISGKRGLMPDLKATCSSCEEEITLEASSKVSTNGNSADVNRRAVYHSVESGGGYEGLASFCGIMNMPCMTKTTYYQHLEKIVTALEKEAKEEMKQAAQSLRECILKEKWQQDQALGTSMYNGDDCLPEVLFELLKPTFLTLSDSKLLKRCVRGATQNSNESINSLVWARCPKHKNHGVKVVRSAAASAVCHFCSGAASRERESNVTTCNSSC